MLWSGKMNHRILAAQEVKYNSTISHLFHRLLTLSLPVTRICVNFSTVFNDTLVVKGLKNFGKVGMSE